jgi:hypothetical protein
MLVCLDRKERSLAIADCVMGRRLEIPDDMRERHGFSSLGAADGEIKTAILGKNGATLHGLDPARHADVLDTHKAAWIGSGAERTNRAYGYVRA